MLNYANLNDTEFEFLCKDIMSKKLNTPLRSFAPGKDGGIDLCSEDKPISEKSIIVQVKHYVGSTPSSLVTSLKKELEKVEKLQPKEYYICCSKKLTPQKIDELYQHFSEYMSTRENIITIIEIDDFLNDKNNVDVLEKHYKLWIASTNILDKILHNDIFIDCEYLLSTIEYDEKYFVQTSTYDKAKEYLLKEKVLMLIGQPGVGKTTISKMLILHFASIGYNVRFTTEVTNLESLKKAISQNREQKEIILLDDCFGQAYFEMKSSQGKELLALIRHVKLSENKILLLNSRITIYQEAQLRSPELIKSIESNEIKIHILDMSEMKNIEKAKILYNHLYFNIENRDFFNAVKENKNYMKIIEHKNYNPRIIEYVSNPVYYSDIKAEGYYTFITEKLDNPTEIWEDEYSNKLELVDRCLIMTIYSLTNTIVNYDLAKKCFNQRIKNIQNIDTSIDQFEKSVLRLSKNFLTICEQYGAKSISFANPSITDFLRKTLESNSLEKENILSSACNINQFNRLLSKEEFRKKEKDFFDTGEICKLFFVNEIDKMDYIVGYITQNQIKNIIYQDYVYEYCSNPNTGYFNRNWGSLHYRVFRDLFEGDLTPFYCLDEYLKDFKKIEHIFEKSDFESTMIITEAMYDNFHHRKGFKELCIKYIKKGIEKYCDFLEVENIDINVENYLVSNESFDSEIDSPDERYDMYETELSIENEVKEMERSNILDVLKDCPYQECKDWFINTPPEFSVYGASSFISSFFAEKLHDDISADYDSSINEIDLMFER